MSVFDLPDFPWDAIVPYAERARRHPDGLIDLSVGSPVDPTPPLIREALAAATNAMAYPNPSGTPALREAIAHWYARRRGVSGLGVQNVLPTIGSKELVGLLPLLLGVGSGDAVVFPEIAYPTYDVGARLVGAEPIASDNPDDWPENTRLVWLNSPANPDGRVLDVAALSRAVERAREIGATIANDECYAELGWVAPWCEQRVPSILDARVNGADLSGVLSVYSLSKQSNLAGYRAAFVAGDESLIARLVEVRKHLGLMIPGPVQQAMIVALGDDDHVDAQREVYRHRRDVLFPALEAAGFTVEGSEAGLYLWATEGRECWDTLDSLSQHGILAGPGAFYGDASRRHVRFALTASDEQIGTAAVRLGGYA